MFGFLGDLAIWTLIFIAGFFAGKKFETLTDVRKAATDKIKSVTGKNDTPPGTP